VVFIGNTIATLRNVSGSFNKDHGLITDGDVNLYVVGGSFSFNPNANGAILNKQTRFHFDRTLFEQNGTTRGPITGFNGIEVDVNGTGGGEFLGCTFRNNTAYGIFLGNGFNVLIRGSTFDNNLVGVFVSGQAGGSTATIVGNTFVVPLSRTVEEGILAWGSRAIATVGGAAASDKNTFRNFAQFLCTHQSRLPADGTLGVLNGGDGLSLDDANLYDNCPTPHHHSDP
jgi:hypothetical protein